MGNCHLIFVISTLKLIYLKQNRTVQLERTSKDYPVQLPKHFRASQESKHVIDSVIKMLLEYLQAWDINHLARRPLPASDHPPREEIFLKSTLKLTWCCSVSRQQRLVLPSPLRCPRQLQGAARPHLSILFSRLDKPSVLNLSSQDMLSCPFNHFVVFLWMLSQVP